MADHVLARACEWLERKSAGTGSLLPIHQDRQPLFSAWSGERAIREGLKASVWVYACVRRLMIEAASVPWIVQARRGDTWERVPGHPLEALIEFPNDHMSRHQLISIVVAHLELVGNALLSKVRADVRGRRGVVAELWPLDPSHIKPIPSRTDFIAGYEWSSEGVVQRFDARDVVHLLYPDPGNPYWGLAPLQAAAAVVDTDVEAVRWNKAALQNRAVPDGVFSFREPLTLEQWEQARDEVRAQYFGADNARTPWVLGGGATFQQLGLSPAEMDFIASRKLHREEIAAVFGVPLPMIGIFEGRDVGDIKAARRIFWEDTIIPLLDDIRDALNTSLVPEFGDPTELFLTYDLSGVAALREDAGAKAQAASQLFGIGVPLDQLARLLDLEIEVPADLVGRSFLGASYLPLGGPGTE
jgi:HK97 family phage portal protein